MYFQIKGFKIKRTYTMQSTFKNLLYVLRHYKLATVTNLLGLSFAFLLFMLISIHVGHEYSFDASLLNRERIFQLENKRDDGIWEANFARPQLERFIAASPYIEAAAITNNLVYSSVRFGISASEGPDARSYMEQVERITPGYTKVFGFELVAGDTVKIIRIYVRLPAWSGSPRPPPQIYHSPQISNLSPSPIPNFSFLIPN